MSVGKIGNVALVLLLVAVVVGVAGYVLSSRQQESAALGVVRGTELRVAPEVGGNLVSIKVQKGDHVVAGDVVAELSALELTASVGQARAALASAIAEREHVYAGMRAEEVAVLADEIEKARSSLDYAEKELQRSTYLAARDFASRQALDEANNKVAGARAKLAEAQANHAAAQIGATQEQKAIAEAQVKAAEAGVAVLERRLEKTVLRAPADGTVSVIVAEVGEAVRAGQPVLAIEETGRPWLSFNLREDALAGLTVGTAVNVAKPGQDGSTPAVVTELVPLGPFATWQAERTVGDHDRNTLRLRLDLKGDWKDFEPGMTVRLLH
jgi:HlyD family secretion protein